ncbi:hypothetical protein Micbo1qcDRAFT_3212 [Microdochium bolleyi]|uniref:Uncharacterized protein n=1 Tax=Microdochium bolleyi TaxID=196109 RepID=A0A136JI26_9PEZI|nr:hypothetical protein Micbo1qcDRAFT_3212 [Microdochium bolleyi]
MGRRLWASMSGVTQQGGQAHSADFHGGLSGKRMEDWGSICCIPGVLTFCPGSSEVTECASFCLYNNNDDDNYN